MSRKIDEVKDLSISDRSIASYGNQRFFVDGLDAPVRLIDLLREIIRRLNLTISSNGSETVVNAGANVTVTGSGTAADPYVIASLGGPVDGSETILNAGVNVTVTGSGTAADPYVIASLGGPVDGSETVLNAGANVTVTGSGTAADPYVIASLGGPVDGSETVLNAGANVTVTGSGTAADPYVIASLGGPVDGSETVLNAGSNVTVTGSGTTADPYVIASLVGPVDGSETVLNAGANVTVTGSGTTADPYVIASTGGAGDGSETVLNAGSNVTVTGSGTAADPYVIASSSGTVPVRDSLSSGIVTAELDRVGGSPCVLTNPNPGEYVLTVPAGASISNITVFGNNTALDALNEFTFRVDNSANTLDRRFLVQIHSGNDGSLIDQQALGCIHYQTVAGNITSLKFLIMNGFGTPGFLIELR